MLGIHKYGDHITRNIVQLHAKARNVYGDKVTALGAERYRVGRYVVEFAGAPVCTCPHGEHGGIGCSHHIAALKFAAGQRVTFQRGDFQADGADYDELLAGALKDAARKWHKAFRLFTPVAVQWDREAGKVAALFTMALS